MFHFLSEYLGELITYIACTCSCEMEILLAIACQETWWFSLIILSMGFQSALSVAVRLSTTLLVIQAGKSEVCIADTCNWMSKNTNVYTIVTDEQQSVEFFLQSKLSHCMLFILHWHHLLALCHFHGSNSGSTSGRTMKPHRNMQECLI